MKMKRKDNDERKWKKENAVRYMWCGAKEWKKKLPCKIILLK